MVRTATNSKTGILPGIVGSNPTLSAKISFNMCDFSPDGLLWKTSLESKCPRIVHGLFSGPIARHKVKPSAINRGTLVAGFGLKDLITPNLRGVIFPRTHRGLWPRS
uniref:Uncharacterized protein n=1 Tax=uncultured marine microorganism HF4000_010I05 TaxID=455517 RepID=B3T1J5_9ZZZZ|nr:hypothetical protein ALOHA_HF4000010I05ctg1g18 [uncultured marine microorganism HF4000_010I05]